MQHLLGSAASCGRRIRSRRSRRSVCWRLSSCHAQLNAVMAVEEYIVYGDSVVRWPWKTRSVTLAISLGLVARRWGSSFILVQKDTLEGSNRLIQNKAYKSSM